MSDEARQNLERLLPGNIRLGSKTGDFYAGTADAVGGRFWISGSAAEDMTSMKPHQLIMLRRKIWEANQAGVEKKITSSDLENISGSLPSFKRRTDDLLAFIIANAKPLTKHLPITSNTALLVEALTIVGTQDRDELRFYLDYLSQRNFVTLHHTMNSITVQVRPEAFVYRESDQKQAFSSTRAFVAMWFGLDMADPWDHGLEPAILDAGYEAFRIDKHEHVNRIDDEILAQIRTSRFLVADFTSEAGKPRGGVYFEAGFALGLDIPVIWTAHERMAGEIHFDTRQYNHIFWKDAADLREKLRNRIIALIGVGPLKSLT